MQMIKDERGLGAFTGNRRTSICMSKLARTLQSAAAKANWNETVKMLFWADLDRTRSDEARKLVYGEDERVSAGRPGESYWPDQFQYMLVLMLVISIAEKRTQKLYIEEFSDRCDAISKEHRLEDDRYWEAGNVPAEWDRLSQEFEERSQVILSKTLREYSQDEIADLFETDGADQFFSIVENVRSQFFRLLENASFGSKAPDFATEGSIPETLPPPGTRKDP